MNRPGEEKLHRRGAEAQRTLFDQVDSAPLRLCGLLLLLSFQAAAAPARPQAKPHRFSSSLDKAKVTLGEPFTLTIEVTHPAADTYALPEPLPLGELSPRGKPATVRKPGPGAAEATTSFSVPLVDVKTLKPAVPDLELRVEGPAGARALTVPGQPLELVSLVEPGGKQGPEVGPRAPKPPVPIYGRSWLWAWGLAGAAAVAALLWAAAVLGRRLRQIRQVRAADPPLTPEEQALQRIAALRARAPWTRGEGRAAIFELSEIMRGYLGARLGFDALDLTTDELLGELRRRRILGLDLTELTEDFSWEDLVKFAKVEPTSEECVHALDNARDLIDRTRPPEARA